MLFLDFFLGEDGEAAGKEAWTGDDGEEEGDVGEAAAVVAVVAGGGGGVVWSPGDDGGLLVPGSILIWTGK